MATAYTSVSRPRWNITRIRIPTTLIRLPALHRATQISQNSGSLWTTYAFQDNPLRGFEVGGGLFVAGDRKADLTNRVNVDAHARVDLFARYKVNETVSLALNVDNLFDEYYVGGLSDPNTIPPGPPRSIFGTIEIKF